MRLTCHCVLLLSTVLASHAMAQTPPKVGDTVSTGDTKRTILSIQDFPAGYQTMKLIAENAPGTCSGRHTHPGIETSYLIEGETTFTIDGKPPTIYKAGGQWTLDPHVVHNACNTGNVPGKTLVTYVMPKGAPIATSESTPEAANAMLAKAVAAVKADRETAFAQMLKGENGFRDGDVYPFCSNATTGKTIVSPKAVPAGTDVKTLKDSSGKNFGQEIAAAGEKPEGTITEVKGYLFPKPDTLAPAVPKTSFVTRVGDLVCGAGYYPSAATN
jgi:quercetin dioxygenase-like cupin family protein